MLRVTCSFITKDAASAEPNHKYDPDISTNIPWTTGPFNSQQQLSLQSGHLESQSNLTGRYRLVQYLILTAF
jgi:hypothetical protein